MNYITQNIVIQFCNNLHVNLLFDLYNICFFLSSGSIYNQQIELQL